jgi:hypothetical protein
LTTSPAHTNMVYIILNRFIAINHKLYCGTLQVIPYAVGVGDNNMCSISTSMERKGTAVTVCV